MRKSEKIVAACAVLFTLASWATLKVWSNREIILGADLNNNFSTVWSATVGSAGSRLIVNSDISGGAAISQSKIATPGLLPKALGLIPCTSGGCTITSTQEIGVSSITRNSAGSYSVTLTTTPTNIPTVILTAISGSPSVTPECSVSSQQTAAPQFVVSCAVSGAAGDLGWNFSAFWQ